MQMVDNGNGEDTVNMEDVFRFKRQSDRLTEYGTGGTIHDQPEDTMKKRIDRGFDQGRRIDHGQKIDKPEFSRARLLARKHSISAINTLSRYALMVLKPRSTMCLYRALCLGNQRVRYMRDSSRYWLPVWQ